MTKYYYFRDTGNRPVVTVCLMKDKAGNVGRGIAVYNDKDMHNPNMLLSKDKGRKYAMGYAKRALGTRKNSEPIEKVDALITLHLVVDAVGKKFNLPYFHSQYNPDLSDYEKMLIKK